MSSTERASWTRVKTWGRDLDGLLRGAFARRAEAAAPAPAVPAERLALLCLCLGGSYGVFMGTYSVVRGGEAAGLQVAASAVKVPLLYLATLLVTFPSLYVFAALTRSGLTFTRMLHALVLSVTVNLAVLASLGPVTSFFAVSTDSYPFMVLLNVAFFAAAGAVGMAALWRSVKVLLAEGEDRAAAARSRRVFSTWCVVFGVVGAQMSWLLRPFIGRPGLPFEVFRARDSSFFEAVFSVLRELIGR